MRNRIGEFSASLTLPKTRGTTCPPLDTSDGGRNREIFFADFEKEWFLREVFLGASSMTSAREIFDATANYEHEVRVARLHLADSIFELKLADCVRA